MRKSDIFIKLLEYTAYVCEVPKEAIMEYSKVQSVVDARTILVYYLRRAGFSNDDIAVMFLSYNKPEGEYPSEKEIKSKAKGIDKMWYSFQDKLSQSFSFGILAYDVKQFCEQTYGGNLYQIGMKKLPTK